MRSIWGKFPLLAVLFKTEFAKRRRSWLTSRCGEVIVRPCVWSVCLSRPLNEAKNVKVVYITLPATQVVGFVKITAWETSCGRNVWTSVPWECTGAFVKSCVKTYWDMLLLWWQCCPELSHMSQFVLSEPQTQPADTQIAFLSEIRSHDIRVESNFMGCCTLV